MSGIIAEPTMSGIIAEPTMSGIIAEPTAPTKIKVMIAINKSNVDSSSHPAYSSGEAFNWTIQNIIAEKVSDYELVLVHVKSPKASILNCFPCLNCYDFISHFNELPEKGERVAFLEDMKTSCLVKGIACEELIKIGDPKKVICSEVKKHKPDRLIVGSRGLNAFQRFFRPSVSEYCKKHAACEVTIISRKEETTKSLKSPKDD